MYVVRLIGGLGNQMFQYAFARKLSLERGVPFKLDVSWYDTAKFGTDAPRRFALERFGLAAELATPEDISKARRDVAGQLLRKVTRKIFGANYGFDPRALRIRDGAYLEGFWQSDRYFADIDEEIRRDFTLKSEMGAIARELSHEISATRLQTSGPSLQAPVSVHIRRGDYVSSKRVKSAFGAVGLDYYRKAADFIRGKEAAPRFFVFSDDIAWVKENLDFGPSAVYVSRPGLDDVEELILMSRCRHHIIANSSFSWWGAWLNPNPDKIVIAPKRWFRSLRFRVRDVVPKNWLRM